MITTTSDTHSSASNTLVTLVIGGIVATIIWEVFARFGAPFWIGGPLQPTGLVKSAFANGLNFPVTDIQAHVVHLLTGLIAFPIGYLFIARPIANAVLPALPWWIVAAVYGVALWVFAMYIMAHLVAGFPPFLGFGKLAYASLVGHVLYALGLGGIVASRS